MKKFLSLTAALLAVLMLVTACGSDNTDSNETTDPAANETTAPDTTAAPELAYKSAEELLVLLMNTYNESAAEEAKLYVAGGNNFNFDTVKMDAPAKFVALADSDYDANLGYPEADVAKLDDAASMFNMMNANVFNCAAFHFANSADVDAMVEPLKANILARQWVCGAPEKLVIIKMPGDYLVMIWGATSFGGIVDPFAASIPTTVEGASIVVEHTFAA